MLYNEKQTAFKASCRPIHKGSYFYDLSELEHCYASQVQSVNGDHQSG
jgi:hypothetical protein